MGACGGMAVIGDMPDIACGGIIIGAPGGHTPIGGALAPAPLKYGVGPAHDWPGMNCEDIPCCAAIAWAASLW